MPQGVDYTTGDVITRLKKSLGFGGDPTAFSRIGRKPITFFEKAIREGQSGEFDPNDGSISVQIGGRSPRQVSRSVAHEDLHAVVNDLLKNLPPDQQARINERVVHKTVRGETQDALKELSKHASNLEDVKRLIRSLEAADKLGR